MTLQDLRAYYRLREYQISHLINAQKCYSYGNVYANENMWLFLLFWADAMYQADEMLVKMESPKCRVVQQSRGRA